MKNNIVKYKDGELEIDVQLDTKETTIWLNRNQIADLFDRDVKTIGKHINNALKEELVREEVVAKFATTTKHGAMDDKTQTHMVDYYNLDMVISVGYRVKSQRGVHFRRWANGILKDYMMQGYAINKKRLEVLNQTVQIQSNIIAGMAGVDADEVYKVVSEYAEALYLLDWYDHQCIEKPEGNTAIKDFVYEDCKRIIRSMEYSQTSNVFGIEKENGKVEGIIAAIYQNVFGQEVYPTLEEKAANLLYFMIKDHPYADGCKRIAAAVFLEFLNKNNALYKNQKKVITDSALVAITLLIAESKPEEKEVMISLIMHFILMD